MPTIHVFIERETHETAPVISPDSRPPLVPHRRPGGLRRRVEGEDEDGNGLDTRWDDHHDLGDQGQINRREPTAQQRGRDWQDRQVSASHRPPPPNTGRRFHAKPLNGPSYVVAWKGKDDVWQGFTEDAVGGDLSH